MLYAEIDPKTKADIWVLPMEGDRKPIIFQQTEFNEGDGVFSPDGRWIAYASDESQRFEVYVQPYPATGAKWQVSKDGGRHPVGRADENEIYWLEAGGVLWAAQVNTGKTFRGGIPQKLFDTRIQISQERYAVSKNGKRFLVPIPVEWDVFRPVTVVENWLASAKQ